MNSRTVADTFPVLLGGAALTRVFGQRADVLCAQVDQLVDDPRPMFLVAPVTRIVTIASLERGPNAFDFGEKHRQ